MLKSVIADPLRIKGRPIQNHPRFPPFKRPSQKCLTHPRIKCVRTLAQREKVVLRASTFPREGVKPGGKENGPYHAPSPPAGVVEKVVHQLRGRGIEARRLLEVG